MGVVRRVPGRLLPGASVLAKGAQAQYTTAGLDVVGTHGDEADVVEVVGFQTRHGDERVLVGGRLADWCGPLERAPDPDRRVGGFFSRGSHSPFTPLTWMTNLWTGRFAGGRVHVTVASVSYAHQA